MRKMTRQQFKVFCQRVAPVLVFLLLGAFRSNVAIADTSLPKESSWAWIHTGPLFDKWESLTGKATVTVNGTTLTAKLFHADYPTLVLFTVTGTVKGEQVRVRVVREHSDSSPGDYSGKIVTGPVTGFADVSAVQTILLYDGWQHQLGLTRTVRR